MNDKIIEFTALDTQSSQDQSFKLDNRIESEKKLNEIMENFTDESEKNSIYISGIAFEKALEIFKKSLMSPSRILEFLNF